MNARRASVLALFVAFGLTACSGDGDGSAGEVVTEVVTETVAPSTTEADEPSADDLEPKITTADFMLKTKIVSKECFGQAGCNVEYEVIPTYLGGASDLDGLLVDVTYKVTGPDDGDHIGTIELDNGSYDIPGSIASTKNDAVDLAVSITDVTVY